MTRHEKLLLSVLFATGLTIACAGEPTAPEAAAPAPSLSIEESETFFQGSDGYWYWNGTAPEGDHGPARILSTRVSVTSPSSGNKSGRLDASVWHDGDEARIDATFYARYEPTSQTLYDHTPANQDWADPQEQSCVAAFWCRPGTNTLTRTFVTPYACGVYTSGTATFAARKSRPWGVVARLLKFFIRNEAGDIVVDAGRAAVSEKWGEAWSSSYTDADSAKTCAVVIQGWNGGAISDMLTGEVQRLRVKDLESVCGSADPSWASGDPSTATVESGGDDGLGIVRARRAGVVTITATCGTSLVYRGAATIKITKSPLTIQLDPGSSLAAGATAQASATCDDPGSVLMWSSLNPSVASIGFGGVITAIAAGQTTIQGICFTGLGSYYDQVGSRPVTVVGSDGSPAITLGSPESVSELPVGSSVQAYAACPQGTTVTWGTTTPTSVHVTALGWVSALAPNDHATVTASCGSSEAQGQLAFRVVPYTSPPDGAEPPEACNPEDMETEDCEYDEECWECQQWMYYQCGSWGCDFWEEWDCYEIDPERCEEVQDEELAAIDRPRTVVTLVPVAHSRGAGHSVRRDPTHHSDGVEHLHHGGGLACA